MSFQICGTLLTLCLLCACNNQQTPKPSPAALPSSTAPAWTVFHVPDSPLSVSLPNTPKKTSQVVENLNIDLYQSRFSVSAITVSAILLPQEIDVSNPDLLYASMQQRIEFAFQKARSFKEVTTKRYLLNDKYPCIDAAYELVLPQGIPSYQRVRFLYTPRYFIQFIAVGPKSEIETPDLDKALELMKIQE